MRRGTCEMLWRRRNSRPRPGHRRFRGGGRAHAGMNARFTLVLGVLAMASNPAAEPDRNVQKQRADLEQLHRILPKSEAWEAWLQRTGELPPDFEAMPSRPGLPDPLERRSQKTA